MNLWTKADLKDVSEVQTGPFGSQLKNDQYVTGGTPVITVEHIQSFRISEFDFPSVTIEDRNRLSKYLLKTGDIVFTRVGSVDLSAYVTPNRDGWMFSSRMLRVRVTNENVSPLFLSYYFRQRAFREYILNISVGATMPSINTGILKGIPISYPSLPEQKAIAGVLSSLDDKIDLLHRQNKTLETLAETLFRQWFIEEAQDDWETVRLEEYVIVHRGLSYKGAGLASEGNGIPMHNLNSVLEGGEYKYSGIKFYSGEYKDRHKISEGDIIVTNTEQGHDLLLIGCPARIPKYYGTTGIFSQHLYKLEIKELLSNEFLYFLLKSHGVRQQITGATNGSTVNMLPRDGIEWAEFDVPPKEKIDDFTVFARKLLAKKDENYFQIKTLEKLRDTLLPKLMSGQVRVDYESEAAA